MGGPVGGLWGWPCTRRKARMDIKMGGQRGIKVAAALGEGHQWESASMPTAAVIAGGSPRVSSGSRMTRCDRGIHTVGIHTAEIQMVVIQTVVTHMVV